MRVLTWNINSVRLRAPIVLRVMRELKPDIIALQETKCPDDAFPADEFRAAGYEHQHINGMKSYNGVCFLSRLPFQETAIHPRAGRDDCRHIAVRVGGVWLHNLYIPAGGDIPDPAANDKFAHKLDYVDDAARWFKKNFTPNDPMIALGDFNIAPLEHDVWSHKQLLDVVSHTPVEVEKITAMQRALNWVDAVRHFVPDNQKCYTWWSYRNQDWKKSNRGRRLDHIWVTPPLAGGLKKHHIHTDARDWDKPSDHVPVMVELSL